MAALDAQTGPASNRFDPFSAGYMEDPYSIYAAVRAESPAFYAPSIDMWVVTRARDIDAIFRDPDRFSAAIAQDSVWPLNRQSQQILADGGFAAAPTMSNCDPPKHGRIRKQNVKAFSARRIRALEDVVQAETARLIEQMEPKRRADVVAELAYPLPAAMIFRLIGFPPADTEMLKSWTGRRLVFTWGRPRPQEQEAVARDMVRYWNYCAEFVLGRLADPKNDFTSDLVRAHLEDPDAIAIGEITNVAYGLSFAGHENLTSLTANSLYQLLSHRDQWEALCADPGLIPNAVEECIRYDSSNPAWRRITTEAVEVSGVQIPANAKVLLLLGAANRDPAWFDDPERLDVRRSNAREHIGFGKGIHYCLGAALTRLEVQIVLQHLTARIPSLRLSPDQRLTYTPNIAFRGPKQLFVEWD